MPWSEHVIQNWEDFQRLIEVSIGADEPFKASTIHRGQSDAVWPLMPTLLRYLPRSGFSAAYALNVEARATQFFQARAAEHVSPSILNHLSKERDVDWWPLMRHYGAPTRLLDWSVSPYVAAYFAAVDCGERDGAIWRVILRGFLEAHRRRFHGPDFDLATGKYDDPNAAAKIYALDSNPVFDRMNAQQGVFTVSPQILTPHDEAIDGVFDPRLGFNHHQKLILPSGLKRDFLKHLRFMNITASSLFPGLEGLGRSVVERIMAG